MNDGANKQIIQLNDQVIRLCDAAIAECDSERRLKLIREINDLIAKLAAERSLRARIAGL